MKHFRFEVTLLPDYNIEEKQTMKIFIKIPPFEVPIQKHLNNTVLLHLYAIKHTFHKGRFQKRFSGFCSLRG